MSSIDTFSYDSISDMSENVSLPTYFWHLYKNKLHTDVKIRLETPDGQETILAHKTVLCIRSPYFADVLEAEPGSKEVKTIKLKKVNREAFNGMMSHMYGNNPIISTAKQACDLHKVAVRFQVNSLMEQCRNFLKTLEIDPVNVFTMLEVAETVKDKSLNDKCLKFIQDNSKQIIASYDLLQVTPAMVHIFVDSAKLSLDSEFELQKWVFSWASEKFKEDNSDCRNTRDFLQKLLPDLHFLALDCSEFATICRDNEGFFRDDEIVSIFMNIAIPGSKPMPDWYDRSVKFRIYTGLN